MIEAVDTVVAQTAVGRTWRPENLARKTVLQLDRLTFDEHFFGSWRRPECRTVERIWHFCR